MWKTGTSTPKSRIKRRAQRKSGTDSATPFASRRDRHAAIGEGSLGDEPFRRLMNDPRFALTPKVLETPKEHPDNPKDLVTLDRQNLARLRSYLEVG